MSQFLKISLYIYIYIYFFFWGGGGQKITLGFSIRCYRKTNPKELLGQPNTYRYAHTHYCYWKSLWDLVACCLKARKQARVVERKVRFISDVGNWWVVDICPEAHFCPQPLPDKQGMRAFIEGGGSGWMAAMLNDCAVLVDLCYWRNQSYSLTDFVYVWAHEDLKPEPIGNTKYILSARLGYHCRLEPDRAAEWAFMSLFYRCGNWDWGKLVASERLFS